jgi:hypothetical protein
MRWTTCLCVIACVAACRPHGAPQPSHSADARAPATPAATAAAADGLQVGLNDAVRTERLQPSRFEDKQAAPGDTFVVLDVSVRNPGRDTRVFNEGALVVAAGGREHRFATPENILADGYLLLEALKPGSSVRGKVVYEVPADLAGDVYWLPGNGQRLRVRTGAATSSPANAGPADVEPADVAQSRAMQAPASPATAHVASAATPAATAQLRQLACRALVEHDDPAEQARYRSFFRAQCAGYAMPKAWIASRAATKAAAPAPASASVRHPPKLEKKPVTVAAEPSPSHAVPSDSGPSFDCSQAVVRAEHLVCADALLSLLDRELAQAVSDAERKVTDPAALARDQEDWRVRVRDACQTLSCLERVYTQRTAGLRAVGGFAQVR